MSISFRDEFVYFRRAAIHTTTMRGVELTETERGNVRVCSR